MKNPVLSASIAFLTRLNLQFTSKIENWRFDLNRVWCGPQSRQKPGECVIFIYRLVEIRSRGLESRQKPG